LLEQLGSPALRARLGEQGRLTAARYSWHRISERLLRYYEDVRLGAVSSGWHAPLDLAATWRYPLPEELPLALGLPDAGGQAQGSDSIHVSLCDDAAQRRGARTTSRTAASTPAPVVPSLRARSRQRQGHYTYAYRAARLLGRKN
jgi:hypothetical protein